MFQASRSVSGKASKKNQKKMLKEPSMEQVRDHRKLVVFFEDTLYAESLCISNTYICVLLNSCLDFISLCNRGMHISSPHHATVPYGVGGHLDCIQPALALVSVTTHLHGCVPCPCRPERC